MLEMNSNILSLYTLRFTYSLIGLDTVLHAQSSPTSGWTKEAIFTLLSVFLTISLAIAGLILRYYMNKGTLSYWTSRRGWRTESGKQHVKACIRDIYLTKLDEELHISPSPQRSCWVELAEARRYQQRTYTSVSRLRRGPRS